ncbi:MAG: hypothetical protein HDR87_00935 [Bacteroides sp.]|nr:hypothetical protein [Bacteroides sp.]MBD5362281.1 hypothetical protein [Bacteroides sp.]
MNLLYILSDTFEEGYEDLCERLSAEEFCNLAFTIVKQTEYLLDRMIKAQEKRFLAEGGIREAMSRARRAHRDNNKKE